MRLFLILALTAAPGGAQIPSVDIIDFFGLHKVPESRVRQALGFTEGSPFPASKGDVEERLDQLPDVVASHLEAVCCDSNKIILYVGIEERGAPHFDIREAPEADVSLPSEIVSAYREFLNAFDTASRRGSTGEDLTHGHELMADPLTREIQQKFPDLARDHLSELRNILRNAFDEEQRAIAAYVIVYAPRKTDVLNDLQLALKDADVGVRANAARGLIALAVFARLNPNSGVRIEPTWFIEMLNSLSWSDRSRALKALQILTDERTPAVLDQLRDRALTSLVEMARWKTLAHALPSFVLVGRLAGMSDPQIQDAWNRGDRESVIAAVTRARKAR